jgi:decaprenylphospho-beta-D-ribofuranose 2-oxidase
MAGVRTALTGWGSNNPSVAHLVDATPEELADLVVGAGARGALARGLGRSYGDAAQNGGGLVLRLPGGPDLIALDRAGATVTAGGGVSLDDVMRVIVPQGWFVPVTPGTRFVTVGGAIASDIHGKNHHADGSFGAHIVALDLLLADGSVRTLTPTSDPAAFWATVGGMGLTGIVLRATFRVLPIETSRVAVDTLRLDDLDALLAAMEEGDHRYRYSVAWIDPLARGSRLGRSVLTRGDHAPATMLAGSPDPLAFAPTMLAALPPIVPAPGVINRWSVAAFNEMWFRKAPRRRDGELQSIASFFHPLDAVARWNRVYGRRGLIQYQIVVPFGAEATMRLVIERLAAANAPSFLAVLKRFGAADPAPLGFPIPGWTLALDVPAQPELVVLLHELDRVVLDAGGRHYLTKDAHTTPGAIRRGYPRLAEWQATQQRLDPGGRWQSDLARRLDLLPAPTAPGGRS